MVFWSIFPRYVINFLILKSIILSSSLPNSFAASSSGSIVKVRPLNINSPTNGGNGLSLYELTSFKDANP